MIRVTLCRDARSCVRCVKDYSVKVLTETDARPSVPTKGYTSRFDTTTETANHQTDTRQNRSICGVLVGIFVVR